MSVQAPAAGAASELAPAELRRLIVLLSLGTFGSAASMRVADAQLPLLATQFSVSLTAAAQVIAVFSVAYGVAQLFYGSFGDRYGKWRVIAIGVAFAGLASAACAAAPDFSFLLLARAAAGVACAAIIPLAMAWIGDVVPYERRQPVLARFLTGQILGMALGQFAGGVAADLAQWRLPYALLAGWFAVGAVLLWRQANAMRPSAASAPSVQAAAIGAAPWHAMGYVLRQPWARWVLLIVFVEAVVLYGPFAFLATHLHLVYGAPLSIGGSVAAFYAIGGVVFSFGSAYLVRRFGEVGLARWGGALMALGFIAVALSPVWWTAPAACTVIGLGFYMLHNTLQTNATQMAPQARGAAVSLFAASFFVGQTVGVGAASLVIEDLGSSAVIVAGGLGVCGVGLAFAAMRRRRIHAER
jgi:predicted MFS family arabinose efflux permease